MTTFAWILTSSLLAGLLSVVVAGMLTLNTRISWLKMLISYAIGALLGAAFLNTLPEAFELSNDPRRVSIIVLIGILIFFILEKLVIWRHCHFHECEAHGQINSNNTSSTHDSGRSGMMIMLGDTFHNFVDGILIATAFIADVQLGIITSIAIITHEIPQEAGNFLILLNSGYTRKKALLFNLFSSFATLIGSMMAYLMLQDMNYLISPLLGLAAASMIYVAMSDLIPGLHKNSEINATIQQVILIILGIGSISIIGAFFTH
tara:strand:- start:48 stop:833 length:786 start_codon:yes stop_codon:yes gene_type:complete